MRDLPGRWPGPSLDAGPGHPRQPRRPGRSLERAHPRSSTASPSSSPASWPSTSVDLQLLPGEVHALVGENGAGKSTLIKVLGGQHQPTSGSILVDGREVRFDDPMQSQRAGISVINQEFNLIPQLTIAANIFLGPRAPRGGAASWTGRTSTAVPPSILRELGLETRPEQRVEYLSVADKQLVEVAKALSQDFRVMIMDEPTATLNGAEVDRLFAIIARAARARHRRPLRLAPALGDLPHRGPGHRPARRPARGHATGPRAHRARGHHDDAGARAGDARGPQVGALGGDPGPRRARPDAPGAGSDP